MRTMPLILLLFVVGACAPVKQPVDLVLRHGAVHTMNPAQPSAEAIAVRGGRIVAVGSNEAIDRAYVGKDTLDVDGQMVLPGFHDAHAHPAYDGVTLSQCNLLDLETVDAIVGKLRACNDEQPGDDWLIGSGWNLSLFPQANPNKALLDAISTTRPIVLAGADGHSSWANSKALALAGVVRATPNPVKGVIERDANGDPSGTLRETAQDLVRAVVPPISPDARRAGLVQALQMANGFGITSIVEAAARTDEIDAYRALDASGELTARVVASVLISDANDHAKADALIRPQDRGTGSRIRTDSAKLFIDGVLEGETAALLQPYLDRPGYSGDLKFAPAQLNALVTDLDRRGVQVHMHAIGDAAVREGLDAFAAARAANGPKDNRHHIAHLQLIDPADRPRFAELGVIANFQALWAFPDKYITDVNLPQVGQARVDQMYPIASVLHAGARIVGGSDWAVSSMNPLLAIQTAVTRSDPAGRIPDVLNAAERVSVDEMLAAYTINGAYLMHQEKDTGSLEVGKLADMIVLSRDLTKIPAAEIGAVTVTRTILEGKIVFRSKPRARA
jgi:predicted amidohydrolase YtcJ